MSDEANRVRAAISIGDVTGIGMEVILKTFMDHAMLQVCVPVIYGSSKTLSFHRKALGINDFNYTTLRNIDELNRRKVNLLNLWDDELKIEFGKPDEQSGNYAMQSLEAASRDLQQGKTDVLITAPLDKHAVSRSHTGFSGHTGYLGKFFEAPRPLMLLVSDLMRVALVTGHLPVRDVVAAVTTETIGASLKTLNQSLRRDFAIRKPRIAVLGLNPHAGDHGAIGNEEQEVIEPAIRKAGDNGILAFGPYPADGFFGAGTFKKFDAVLAMYHDQGLVPFKALSFGGGVNFTAGLPVVRTSPDHGTGFNIAGKNEASEASFRKAVYMACDIRRNRMRNDEAGRNPLPQASMSSDR